MNKEKILKLANEVEEELQETFKKYDKLCEYNSNKVLSAFWHNQVSEAHFQGTTGYGYGDMGRDTIESVFAEVLDAEDALVRNQFISGSHALNVCFFGILRPNDTLLSITGTPYDTLHEVIGIKDNPSSLKSFGINYDEIDLVKDDFDYSKIKEYLENNKVKMIHIQRSKGYSNRKSITIKKLSKVIDYIKSINKDIIIMVDNCYCEFVEESTPISVGADIMVGSLIKNLGGGISPNGGYIAGKKSLVNLCSERLTLPGEGKEVGPSLGINKLFLQGLYLAPGAVNNSLKVATFTSKMFEKLNIKVDPLWNEQRADIVLSITFNDKEKLIKYIEGIQKYSAIDSHIKVVPANMPGYTNKIIMASGSFNQGSSIELSCDGPIKSPFIAYQQGSLTYEYGKIAVVNAIIDLYDLQ